MQSFFLGSHFCSAALHAILQCLMRADIKVTWPLAPEQPQSYLTQFRALHLSTTAWHFRLPREARRRISNTGMPSTALQSSLSHTTTTHGCCFPRKHCASSQKAPSFVLVHGAFSSSLHATTSGFWLLEAILPADCGAFSAGISFKAGNCIHEVQSEFGRTNSVAVTADGLCKSEAACRQSK